MSTGAWRVCRTDQEKKPYRSVACHLDAGVQELVKVLAELPRGHGQLAAGAAGGVDDLSC